MTDNNRRLTYLDLFAGAGGLSEGFNLAGYQPVAHVEMDGNACFTLKTRECYYYLKEYNNLEVYREYLLGNINRNELYSKVPEEILDSVICETMSEDNMEDIFAKIDKSFIDRKIKHLDFIIGGPPCQAYSVVGRSRKDMTDDPRNVLYRLYLQALERYQPDMFVFENVPGIKTASKGAYFADILSGFEELGYSAEYKLLNSSEYGVLQRRHRYIIVGWKEGTQHSYPDLQTIENKYYVNDILEDLPVLLPGEKCNIYRTLSINEYLTNSGIRKDHDVLTWHIARPCIERDREIYRIAIRDWNNGHKRLVYTDLPDQLMTHKNRRSFLDRFKVVAADLPTCHTMVAHISKDGHYYIHPDINQARSISVREAARIQSFPDDFFFEGPRTSAFKQIGNAVPPLLARAIAIALAKQF